MIIKFSFENFKSFQERNILNLIAAPIGDLESSNIIETDRLKLLKSVAIYGGNASGKSNLLDAIVLMRWLVLNSSKNTQVDEPINVIPFKLNTTTENNPCFFEIEFLIKETRYRYGFMATQKKVESEWLFYSTRTKEFPLFVRQNTEYKIWDKFKEGRGIEEKTRDNALFLSVVAQFNGEKSKEILHWFGSIKPVHGLNTKAYIEETIKMLSSPEYSSKIKQLIKEADLGIDDVKYQETELKVLTAKVVSQKNNDRQNILTFHKKYDENKKIVGVEEFILSKNESAGTEKYFDIIGVLLKSVTEGKIVVIDELDARLHPLLCKAIVKMFNSTNNQAGQLIFTTHDTNILHNNLLRRDQIFFIEKDIYGSSNSYSLVEFKPRKNSAIDQNYLHGKFGAIPFIDNLNA